MKKRFVRIFTVAIAASMLFMCFPTAAKASSEENSQEQSGTEISGVSGLFDSLWGSLADIDVTDEDIASANEEISGNPDYDAFNESIGGFNRFVDNFAEQEYDEDDFGGNADEVYGAAKEGLEAVEDSGLFEKLEEFGKSALNFVGNIFKSIGKAFSS